MAWGMQTAGALNRPSRLGEEAKQVCSHPRLEELADRLASGKTLDPGQIGMRGQNEVCELAKITSPL